MALPWSQVSYFKKIQIITIFLLIFLQLLLVPISTSSTHMFFVCPAHVLSLYRFQLPMAKETMVCNHKCGKAGIRYLTCTWLLNQKWSALADSSSNAESGGGPLTMAIGLCWPSVLSAKSTLLFPERQHMFTIYFLQPTFGGGDLRVTFNF